jgi:hypothetical protein
MTELNQAQRYLLRDFVRGGGKELDFSRYFHLFVRTPKVFPPLPAAADCVAYVKKRFIWENVSKNVLAIYDDAFRAKHAGLWNRPREIAA